MVVGSFPGFENGGVWISLAWGAMMLESNHLETWTAVLFGKVTVGINC